MEKFLKTYYKEIIFVLLEAVMFCLIFFLGKGVNITAFISVCLCLTFVLLSFRQSADWVLLTLGLCFTVAADTLLVLLSGREKLLAMCFFLVAQFMYFLRVLHVQADWKTRFANAITAVVLVAIAVGVTAGVLKGEADALAYISVTYYALLLTNMVFAFVSFKRLPLFALGMLLFALCDLVIGLRFMCDYIHVPADSFIRKIAFTSFNLPWLFYLPSQILIALSVRSKKRKA
jgi:hypothetical protein